jgi:spore coat polysaccharide biosynthesis protein SpsF
LKLAIIQARMGSTRLPGKVLQRIGERTVLEMICTRVRKATSVDELVVATSDNARDNEIEQACLEMGVNVFRGSENDVLERFYQACLKYNAVDVLRITADCPLVDSDLISRLYNFYKLGGFDHAGVATGAGVASSNIFRFPDGLDCEWFNFHALEKANASATNMLDREHVTSYIWNNKNLFKVGIFQSDIDYSNIRLTLDTPLDLDTFNEIYRQFGDLIYTVKFEDVVDWINQLPSMPPSFKLLGKENYGDFYNEAN